MPPLQQLTDKLKRQIAKKKTAEDVWKTCNDLLRNLRTAAVAEASVAVRFQLTQQIEDEERKLAKLDEELDGLAEAIAQIETGIAQILQPAEEGQPEELSWEELYNALWLINYTPQKLQFMKYIRQCSVGAFVIYGIFEGGQRWLLNRLRKDIPSIDNRKVFKVDSTALVRAHSTEAIWRQIGSQLGILSPLTSAEIAKKVCALWQTQTVLIVFDNVDLLPPDEVKKLISGFWHPLFTAASKQQPQPSKYGLLMFLLAHQEVGDWDVGFPDTLDPDLEPLPIKLPQIMHLSTAELIAWSTNISPALSSHLPEDLDQTESAFWKQSEGGVPMRVFELISQRCGHSWFAYQKQWEVL